MLNNTEVISRIEEIRNNHQLTAASFASKIGVQRSAMSHILSGRNKPSLDFLMKIYDAFDEVNLEWLLLGKSPPLTQPQDDFRKTSENDKTEADEIKPDIQITESKIETLNLPISCEAPKEIIYLYANGKFERFTPKN
ncbi:MAG: transcriptional regulator [Flavobacteriales bacterium MED-G15]|jgi:transcriptional regulator with XRE-family HTH domain|nr:MAG: transcriptional regulator [Flavobacteriales bacterium MED-G15]|tara:strand:- start:3144 stop:3557 length:414 start_codon:yes stop_codon:yes gene_type:complete